MNINIKRCIHPCALLVVLLIQSWNLKAGLIISGLPIANPAESNTFMTVSGKLVDVEAAFSSVNEMGNYTENSSGGNYILVDLYILDKDCCVFSDSGKEPEFKANLTTVTYTYSPEIKLPTWSDRQTYGVSCPAAGGEWDRVYNAIRAHEYLHSDAAKSVLNVSNANSVYSNIVGKTGNCVPTESYESYRESFAQLIRADIDADDEQLQSQLNNAQDSVDIMDPPGLIIVDTSKDCP